MTEIVNLSYFNSTHVEEHFRVPPERKTDRLAMRYLFNMMAEDIPPQTLSKAQYNRLIADVTIEKLSFRYELADEFFADFFRSENKPDRDGLMLALICDGHVAEMNPLIEPENKADNDNYLSSAVTVKDEGFDPDLVERACIIWEEAVQMGQHGVLADDDADQLPSAEAVFLAHINALENLRDMDGHEFDDLTEDDIALLYETDFAPMRQFINHDTRIGARLKEFLDHIEARAMEVIKPYADYVRQSRPAGPTLVLSSDPS